MEFNSRIITYGELRKGLTFESDKYGVASYEYEPRRNAFLANPCTGKDEDFFMYLIEADGIPVGRTMLFDTRLKVGNELILIHSGSALHVEDSFQKYGLGGEIFMWGYTLKNVKHLLSSGISGMALPLYKRLKYTIFEFPKMLLIRNTRSLLEKLGIKGFALKCLLPLSNLLFKIPFVLIKRRAYKLSCKYEVKRMETIPSWVDDMIRSDTHKYSEYHGSDWLQWNLDYNFKGDERDIQRFYGVYENDNPVGFFMTKERFKSNTHGLKNVLIGSIVEWQSIPDTIDEYDLTIIASNTLSDDVDIIETATADLDVAKRLKRIGFLHYGDAHIAFKDKTKSLSDHTDANLWRLRYGYADVILS